ncbi:unnamed protein product [Penicillium egyptiacum]|uniref:non-specific serine/threonine protein kinase n=1 Tax=Penicillium egyptiacum TaxID=1303716 RepID=A0A9W4KC94_9EURO|nr:unnamed protein product [Penicillium egyptiacum]
MADESPSVYNLIEELGFLPSEHQFLIRLFSSSDPFAGLPSSDIDENQSGQLSSTSTARRLASTRLWQDIFPLTGGRDLVHYEREWTSLIGTDSESLFSELLQQLATEDVPPCLESPELHEHPNASENVVRPGSVEPASSSVYSETGEPPESVDNINETPGAQGNCEESQDPRTLTHPGSFERLLESFPRPPGRNQRVREQSFSHISSDAQQVPPKDSAQANTSTLANSQIEPVSSLPRISRFSEVLGNSNPIGEQDSASICAKTDTSAHDNSGLGNTSTSPPGISPPSCNDTSTVISTRNISPQIPSLLPSASFRDSRLPIDYQEGQQVSVESPHQAQGRGNRYTIFPGYPPRVRPIGYVIRKQHSFRTIFEGCPSPRDSPRYYQKSPLRISTRPSTISFNSGKKSTPKHKRVLKRFEKSNIFTLPSQSPHPAPVSIFTPCSLYARIILTAILLNDHSNILHTWLISSISSLTMDSQTSRLLDPSSAMAAITKHKAEAIKLAREQGVAVQEMCRRAKTEVPPYEFEELIGKGAYGRVYKGRQRPLGRLVAIKVLDIDSLDYKSVRDFRDESIKDFIHETKVMKQVKDSGAKNINEIIEAISIHSQLWLVCEYCPGGSVRTLMRATNDKLDEKYIIPIARELAIGLHAIHGAGIIHRDVKAANILVHEEGRLEICDFGVAGVLQSQRDKRSTWIGTPHWMPPEMFATRGEPHQYGNEIDVWAYGCTLFEFANGNPPNAGLRERMQIGRQLNRKTPQLDSDKYSQGLKDLIAYALDSNPDTRPTMADILAHPYIADTEEKYPTASVSELVRNYYQWSQRGGQRISLFHPGGAAAAELPGIEESEDDWNFSTTDGFERRFSVIDLDEIAASLAEMEKSISPTDITPEQDMYEKFSEDDLNYEDKANFDERVRRGAVAMEGLFDEEKPSYKYETKNDFVPIEPEQPTSDLPLRAETDRSSVTSTFLDIDIGSFEASHYAAGAPSAQPFQLVDADTIRANRSSLRLNRTSSENSSKSSDSRANDVENLEDTFVPSGPRPPTMDWKFPSFVQDEDEQPEEKEEGVPAQEPIKEESFQAEKRATMQWTFPVMGSVPESESYDDRHDTLRAPLPEVQPPPQSQPPPADEPGDSRPSTSASNTSDSDYDPFRFDRPTTPQGANSVHHSHFFDTELPAMMELAGYNEYEASGVLDGPGPDEESHPVWKVHSRTSSYEDSMTALPTAIPVPQTPTASSVTSGPVSEPGSPVFETVRNVRHDVSEAPMTQAEDKGPILFPALDPPSAASLMEGMDDGVVTAELDRLLADFLESLSATGEALSRAEIKHETNGVQLVEQV